MTAKLLDSRFLVGLAVAAPLVALALFGGGYSDLAVGTATLLVWTVLLVGVLTGALARSEAPGAFLLAGALLTALLAITALSLSWTTSPESGFAETIRLGGYLGAFILAGLVLASERRGGALAGIAIAGVAVSLLAIGSRLFGIGGGDAELVASLPTASGRLSYPLGYWNALGALAALSLPPLVWIATATRHPLGRSAAMAAFAPPLLVAYMTSSRGALIAVALGLSVVVAFAGDRQRSAAVAALGIAAALPAVLVATLVPGILSTPGYGTPGTSELSVALALAAGMAAAFAFGSRTVGPLSRSRFLQPRLRLRSVLAALGAGAAIVIVLAGPSALIGDLRATPDVAGDTSRTGIVSTSGSGRAQFWAVALEAFESEPLRGIGSGAYESYWSQKGSFKVPARNAHSEPLEALAELGVVGLACFLGFLGVALVGGARRAREDSDLGPALGIVAAGLVGFTIDWTWQVPAVAVPVLVAAAILTRGAAAPGRLAPRLASRPRVPAAALGLGIVMLSVAALWGGGVLAIAASRLDASDQALARGQLDQAAAAARTAAAVEPWAAAPWLRLAVIEQAGSNLRAAATDAAAAIERAPDDSRLWQLATNLQAQLANARAATAYGRRALVLGGLLPGESSTGR